MAIDMRRRLEDALKADDEYRNNQRQARAKAKDEEDEARTKAEVDAKTEDDNKMKARAEEEAKILKSETEKKDELLLKPTIEEIAKIKAMTAIEKKHYSQEEYEEILKEQYKAERDEALAKNPEKADELNAEMISNIKQGMEDYETEKREDFEKMEKYFLAEAKVEPIDDFKIDAGTQKLLNEMKAEEDAKMKTKGEEPTNNKPNPQVQEPAIESHQKQDKEAEKVNGKIQNLEANMKDLRKNIISINDETVNLNIIERVIQAILNIVNSILGTRLGIGNSVKLEKQKEEEAKIKEEEAKANAEAEEKNPKNASPEMTPQKISEQENAADKNEILDADFEVLCETKNSSESREDQAKSWAKKMLDDIFENENRDRDEQEQNLIEYKLEDAEKEESSLRME